MEDEEKFSDNERENLAINNELIRLKMSAQYGDAFMMSSRKDLPPEIENQFLKNILAFEDHIQKGNKTVTVYEKIGKPAFTRFQLLDVNKTGAEIERLELLLNEHGMGLHFLYGPYSNEIMYRFITEELFLHEVDDINIPGMMCNFIYEEFHVNNEMEIKERTHQFFADWLLKEFGEFSDEMSYDLLSSSSEKLTRDEAFQKIRLFSDCYVEFKNDGYNIDKIQVDEQQDGSALGFSEGMYKYEGILENGESQYFEGPFKLYMKRHDNDWSIFYFIVPGFTL